jgi:MFS family permease
VTGAALLQGAGFRRLFAARVLSQLADGVFQASLAGAVFFNPEHVTDPRQAAAGFLVLYLPYSFVSPFAGVLLDRWRRQRSMLACCLVRVPLVALVAALIVTVGTQGPRSAWLYVAALAVLGISRFFIAAAGAALPHVVDEDRLVNANALAGTSGTVAAFVAGILALVVRGALPATETTDAALALASAAAYLLAAAVLMRFRADALGPDTQAAATRWRTESARVVRELADGARHVRALPVAVRGLAALTAYRLCMGSLTLDAVLLYRNEFADIHGALPGGQTGLAEMVGASALGILVSAFVTPRVTGRIGKPAWVALLLVTAGAVVGGLGPSYKPLAFLLAGLVVGAVGQGVKICIDTLLQEVVADEFRGRAFAFYDALFNLAFALGAVAVAFILPTSGRSIVVLEVTAGVFVAAGLLYGRAERSSVERLGVEAR